MNTHKDVYQKNILISNACWIKKGEKVRRLQYYECPYCGSHLDYGEKCDCEEKEARKCERANRFFENLFMVEENGQLRLSV